MQNGVTGMTHRIHIRMRWPRNICASNDEWWPFAGVLKCQQKNETSAHIKQGLSRMYVMLQCTIMLVLKIGTFFLNYIASDVMWWHIKYLMVFSFLPKIVHFISKNTISCLFLKNVSPSKRVICFILNNLHFPMVEGNAFYALHKSAVKQMAFVYRTTRWNLKMLPGIVIHFRI